MAYCPDQLRDFLKDVVGVVDANSYETMCLYEENLRREEPRVWTQNSMGLTEVIGHLDGRPVNLSLFTNQIGGWKLLFLDCISQVVDHEMVDKWLVKNLPPSAMRANGYPNRTNAMNFCNIFPSRHRVTIQIG